MTNEKDPTTEIAYTHKYHPQILECFLIEMTNISFQMQIMFCDGFSYQKLLWVYKKIK